VLGLDGKDTLIGGSGNDNLDGGAGADKLQGGAGSDTASYASSDKGVTVSLANPDLNTGDAKGDTFSSIENLTGTGRKDVLTGDAGDNVLRGSEGADQLVGGKGADELHGGVGKDVFVFNDLSDSTVNAGGRDTIVDFSRGDQIDLSAIDANSQTKGNQDFSFIGTDDFDGKAGELRYEKHGSDVFVFADTDGDKHADFALQLDDVDKLAKHDFML
jgi:Ca2+-binding RTX toxin-like protein